MPGYQELDQRWRLLAPPDAVVVRVEGPRQALRQRLAGLPEGSTVVLAGGRRQAGLARRAGIRVRARYLALPSLAAPVAITRLDTGPARFLVRTVLTVPSGAARTHLPLAVAIRLVRALPRLLYLAPAGDRLLVGVRGGGTARP